MCCLLFIVDGVRVGLFCGFLCSESLRGQSVDVGYCACAGMGRMHN